MSIRSTNLGVGCRRMARSFSTRREPSQPAGTSPSEIQTAWWSSISRRPDEIIEAAPVVLIWTGSHFAPRRLRRIAELKVDWTDAADGNDGRLIVAANHAIIMRRQGDAVHVAACRNRHAGRGIEIGAAVAPPRPRQHHAIAVGRIKMRRAHISWMPAHERVG